VHRLGGQGSEDEGTDLTSADQAAAVPASTTERHPGIEAVPFPGVVVGVSAMPSPVGCKGVGVNHGV
jgi:hypothetical protein